MAGRLHVLLSGAITALLLASSISAQTISEFPVGAGPIGGITAGPDGNLWFTETAANRIGRMTPAGAVTEFEISTPGTSPGKITSGPDGRLWFTETGAKAIGRISIDGGIVELPLPFTGFSVHALGIAAGPDGNVWYTLNISRIGHVSVDGSFQEFGTNYDTPTGITTGPDSNIWFTTNGGVESKICRITPAGFLSQFGAYAELSGPTEIVSAPDGNLWFIQQPGPIGRITMLGVINQFEVGVAPLSIAAWNGDLWLGADREIIRLTTAAKVTERIAVPSAVPALAPGPDGNLWFVEASGVIGRFTFERRRSARH